MNEASMVSPSELAKLDTKFLLTFKESVCVYGGCCIKSSVKHIKNTPMVKNQLPSFRGLGLFGLRNAVNTSNCHEVTVFSY